MRYQDVFGNFDYLILYASFERNEHDQCLKMNVTENKFSFIPERVK